MISSYLTISGRGEGLFKSKGSKHFGLAYPVKTEEEINHILDGLRKEHHNANHVCYAWCLGADRAAQRANDDGEPSNSAGKPILGQIEKRGLTNVLVAVVRYFGGTKLGVGGLIEAYRNAAELALENAGIKEIQLLSYFRLHFGYERMSEVMLAIRMHNWTDSNHDYKTSCRLEIAINPENKEEIHRAFQPFTDIRIEYLGTY